MPPPCPTVPPRDPYPKSNFVGTPPSTLPRAAPKAAPALGGGPGAAPSLLAPQGGPGMVPGGPQGPVPADGPVPGAAFPHPALVLCLLVVVLVMAVVAPAGSRGDDGPGLPRGVIRAVFCRKRGKLRAGGAGTPGVPSPPPPHTSQRCRHSPVPRPRSTCCCLQQGVTGVGWEPAPDSPAPAGTNARKSRGTGSAPGARPGKLPSEGKTPGWEEGEREEKPRERGGAHPRQGNRL